MKRRVIPSKQDYQDVIVQKLQKSKKYLMYGPCNPEGAPLRDEVGVATSFANIMKIADNHYDFNISRGNGDCVADSMENFSNVIQGNFSGESYGNVSLVATVGAVDVTVLLFANSLIPFLAVDRAMSNPQDTVYYANLISTNSAAGVTAGTEVINNFQPPNPNVNLGPANLTLTATATTTSQTLNFNEIIVPGDLTVTVVRGTTTYTGKDYNKDGNIYWSGPNGANPGIVGTIVYSSGVLTLASGVVTGDVITAVTLLDVTSDSSGNNILQMRAEHIPTTLIAQPKAFIFQENEISNLYMSRIMSQASKAGGITDYRDLHFSRLTNLYIENVNRDLIHILINMSSNVTAVQLNLASYTAANSFALTKDDVISKFIIDMRLDLLQRTGQQATVCVCGSLGAGLLESVKDKWIPGPNFYTQLNGFIGTFNNLPVYRHNLIDSLATQGVANYYLGCKLPDNSSGSMIFGEFIPLIQTSTVGNVNNPLQKATSWYSMVASIPIQNQLVAWGQVQLGSYV